MKLIPGKYKVNIDTEFINGSLSFGEGYLKGSSKKEILISTHICHPSMQMTNFLAQFLLYCFIEDFLKLKKENIVLVFYCYHKQ